MMNYFFLSDYENERINFNDFLKELLKSENNDKKAQDQDPDLSLEENPS